jgi:hypothetical protein
MAIFEALFGSTVSAAGVVRTATILAVERRLFLDSMRAKIGISALHGP